jgi:guanylate kinase
MTNAPHLVHKTEFEQLLSDYLPGAAILEQAAVIKMIILTGPTCSGRNTIVDLLKVTNRYHFAVSDTTRLPKVRNGALELTGKVYNFITEESFLSGLRQKEYLEAELIHGQQVSGCNIFELKKAMNSNKVAIREMDPIGSKHMIELVPEAMPIFISPPAFDQWMARLHKRDIVQTSELIRRLKTALTAFDLVLTDNRYNIYLNDDLTHTVQKIDEIVASHQIVRSTAHLEHIQSLKDQTVKLIGTLE